MPEVSLVAILDADKEGFLRSDTSLIQTIGRAARHVDGKVIMYADRVTGSMERAIGETNRRREVQDAYNKAHHITPRSIQKDVKDLIELTKIEEETNTYESVRASMNVSDIESAPYQQGKSTKKSKAKTKKDTPVQEEVTLESVYNRIEELNRLMKAAAKQLEFEKAAAYRDELGQLRQLWSDMHKE